VTNRASRRRSGQSELPFQASLTIRVPGAVRPLTIVRRDAFSLWSAIVEAGLDLLGITDSMLRTAYLLDFLNRRSLQDRKMLSVGVVEGLGLVIKEAPDNGETVLEASFEKLYPPLIPPSKKLGLWTPGE